MTEHPYGWLSLTPPLVTISLAILTRRVIVSLLAGILAGALVTGGNLVTAVSDTMEIHLWKTLVDEAKLRVFSFTLLMGAMVGVINRSGGMRGLVQLVSPFAKSRRRGQLTTWLLGLLVFFDDYANTMLLGSTLRPLCDRLKISREKLAYLVDSTAAPVAGLTLVSTWVAVEIDYIRDGIHNLSTATDLAAFDLFVASIPYRFYPIFALVLVPLVAVLGRDYGSMHRAEQSRLRSAKMPDNGTSLSADPTDPDPRIPARWYNAAVPITITLGVIVWLLVSTGREAFFEQEVTARSAYIEQHPNVEPDLVKVKFPGEPKLRDIVGAADSSIALQRGALAGLLVIAVMARLQGLLDGKGLLQAAAAGAKVVLPAIAILWLASTLSRMTGNTSVTGEKSVASYEYQNHRLYTGEYLSSLLIADGTDVGKTANDGIGSAKVRPRQVLWLLPSIVFILAAATAFSTGSSWGTMGILMPMTLPLAYQMLSVGGTPFSADHPILLSSIGSVLAGAIFGDHCSPISDTTILSSQSSGCEHMAHVWTQMPYALSAGLVAILFGTLPVGLGAPVWVLLPLGSIALLLGLLLLGKRVE